nr:hypothetical protein Q903MT_gene297 [Picea sitchensis]
MTYGLDSGSRFYPCFNSPMGSCFSPCFHPFPTHLWAVVLFQPHPLTCFQPCIHPFFPLSYVDFYLNTLCRLLFKHTMCSLLYTSYRRSSNVPIGDLITYDKNDW